MADLILGDRFESRGLSAWHGKGHVFPSDETISLIQAADRVAADIRVYLCDEGIVLPDGTTYGDNKSKAVMRAPVPEDPIWRKFGSVEADSWKTLQYVDYAALLNDLSSKWPVETCGVIRDGRQFWFALRMGNYTAKGPNGYEEEFNGYIIGLISQEPDSAHKIYVTQVRPVCSNTLMMGWNNAISRYIVDHRGDAAEAFRFVSHVAQHAQSMQVHMAAAWEAFMRQPLRAGSEEFKALLTSAFPLPAPSQKMRAIEGMGGTSNVKLSKGDRAVLDSHIERHRKTTEYVQGLHDAAGYLMRKFNDEFTPMANTAWAAWNAVTELADHRQRQSREDVQASVLQGERFAQKARAFANLSTLCGLEDYAAN